MCLRPLVASRLNSSKLKPQYQFYFPRVLGAGYLAEVSGAEGSYNAIEVGVIKNVEKLTPELHLPRFPELENLV